jgi:hypothetical protein
VKDRLNAICLKFQTLDGDSPDASTTSTTSTDDSASAPHSTQAEHIEVSTVEAVKEKDLDNESRVDLTSEKNLIVVALDGTASDSPIAFGRP